MNFLTEAFAQKDALISFRRMLHQNPEIGLKLPFTTDAVCAALKERDIAHKRVLGGIIATIGKPEGRRILLRGDMDALPIQETRPITMMRALRLRMWSGTQDIASFHSNAAQSRINWTILKPRSRFFPRAALL